MLHFGKVKEKGMCYLAHITEVLVQQFHKQMDRFHQQQLIIRRICSENKV